MGFLQDLFGGLFGKKDDGMMDATAQSDMPEPTMPAEEKTVPQDMPTNGDMSAENTIEATPQATEEPMQQPEM